MADTVYISADQLRQSIASLGLSRAHQRLVDYLIIKRGIKLSNTDSLALGMESQEYIQAIKDLMATGIESPPYKPYINVFGAGRHSTRGYRLARYPNNGTNVSVRTWPSSVISIIQEGPRIVRFPSNSSNHLADEFLIKKGTKPALFDAAIWYYRGRNIASLVGGKPLHEAGDSLGHAFQTELGLGAADVNALFDQPLSLVSDWRVDELPAPVDYLPQPSDKEEEASEINEHGAVLVAEELEETPPVERQIIIVQLPPGVPLPTATWNKGSTPINTTDFLCFVPDSAAAQEVITVFIVVAIDGDQVSVQPVGRVKAEDLS